MTGSTLPAYNPEQVIFRKPGEKVAEYILLTGDA